MKTYTYDYPRPALTVDCVLFRAAGDAPPQVLLIQRASEPYRGRWALPGGFVDEGESPEAAVRRELLEETGIEGVELRQFHTFGTPGRDPRGWVVSVAFFGEVGEEGAAARAGSDARRIGWFAVAELPPLAFDHADMLRLALARWRNKDVGGGGRTIIRS